MRHLWGKSNMETNEALLEAHGSREIGTLSIGPAGEKKVAWPASFPTHHGHVRRTGIGAVMGSKNLKAVATAAQEMWDRRHRRFQEGLPGLPAGHLCRPVCSPATKYGTCRFMYHRVKFGIHGPRTGVWGLRLETLDPEVFRGDYQVKASACPCARSVAVANTGSPRKVRGNVTKLEWETIAAA